MMLDQVYKPIFAKVYHAITDDPTLGNLTVEQAKKIALIAQEAFEALPPKEVEPAPRATTGA
jgi:hypothetical protein